MSTLVATSLTIQDDVTSRGGVPLVRVADWIEVAWQETSGVGGAKNRGYARLVVPADSPVLASATILSVLRIDDPQPVAQGGGVRTWEFRITELDDGIIVDGKATAVATLAPIIEDFGRFQMRVVSGGVPTKLIAFTGTPTAFLEELLIPALEDPDLGHLPAGSVVVGTVTPAEVLTYSGRDVSVLAVLTWLEQQTNCDAWLERTSETTFALHLTARGTDAASPVAFVGRNVEALDRVIIIDDRFATRVEPEGRTASGEQDPTHIGGATWSATLRDGGNDRLITMADPAGGTGPVVADDDLNGTQAFYPLDPLHGTNTTTAPKPPAGGPSTHPTAFVPLGLAVDPVRRVLWGYTEDGTDTLWWRSLADDETHGTVALGSGATWITALAYDPTTDRIIAACGDVAKVVILDPATKAITHTVTTSAVPWGMSIVESLGLACIGYDYSGGQNVEIINPSSGTIVNTLASTSTFDGRYLAVVYNTAHNRLFAFDLTGGAYAWFNGTTYAAIGTGTGVTGWACSDPAAATILVLAPATKYAIDPSTGAKTSTTLPEFPGTPTGTTRAFFAACGRHYFLTTKYLIGFDASLNVWVTPAADVGRAEEGSILGIYVGYALEYGASASQNVTVYTGDVGCVRRFVLTPIGDPVSPFESWPVVDADAGPQTITAPGASAGGPVRIPVEADGVGQGALVQFRQDAALAYRTRLADATAVDAWGPIDASPQFDVLGKTNYWRGSTFAADTFRADGTCRHLAVLRDGEAHFGAMANRWQLADQTGFAFRPLTLTANVDTSTYNFPDVTMAVSGLNNGTVLSPGDVITTSPLFGPFPAGVTPPHFYVRQRTVADASGNATIPVTPFFSGGAFLSAGDTVYLTSPAFDLAPGRANCLALYPTFHANGFVPVRTWPTYRATIPVPQITGDAVCWVVLHVKIACYHVKPSDLKFSVRAPYTAADLAAISPADTIEVNTGEIRDYWLAQRVDLLNPSHGFIGASITCGPTTTQTGGLNAVLYPQSLQVVLAAASPEPLDLFGAEGPRTLYQLAAARLAAGNAPTINYQLRVLEDDAQFVVGARATLRDPARGIATDPASPSCPRVVAVTRFGSAAGVEVQAPEVELGNAPLASFTGSIVSTESKATRPSTTTAIVPSATVGGTLAGSGGGVGVTPFVDPGVERNFTANFVDSMGDAGLNQSTGRYDFVSNDSAVVLRSSAGFGGGACVEEAASGGVNDTYWQYTDLRRTSLTEPNDVHVGFRVNLNGQTVPAYHVPLLECYPVTCAIALEPDRRISLHIDDGIGHYKTLGTSVDPVIPATGQVHVEFRAHSGTTGDATGFVWVRINGALVAFTPNGGGAPVHGFENVTFTATHSGRISESVAIGTGSGYDYPWDPQTDDTGTFVATGYNTVGGIAGVQWDDFIVNNLLGGAATYDFAGPATVGVSSATTSGLSSDDGDTSYDAVSPNGATRSYSIGAIASAATDILGVAPFALTKVAGTHSPFFCDYSWTLTSSATPSATVYIQPQSFGSYDALLENPSTALPKTSGNSDPWVRWFVALDPATSAAWTRTALAAITIDLVIVANLDAANALRISEMGVDYVYRT